MVNSSFKIMKLERMVEMPEWLDTLKKEEHRVYTMTSEELSRYCVFPKNVGELSKFIKSLRVDNNFSRARAPFIKNLRAIVGDLFARYTPKDVACLEFGPGPVAYAANHVLPLEEIALLSMVEGSELYHRKIRHKAQAKRWKLYHADFHTFDLYHQFDVVFGLSALDSTEFPYDVMITVAKHLKKDGVGIFVQDVFPCPVAILGQEYLHGNNPITFASEASCPEEIYQECLLWVVRDGREIASTVYLQQSLKEAAQKAGLTLVEHGIICASEQITRSDATKRLARKLPTALNRVGNYFVDAVGCDERIPPDYVEMAYSADVLVLKK